jgi:phage terminase large subunit
MYYPTKALKKIATLGKPTKVIQGGQGAGKTIGIIILLINHCLHQRLKEVTIVQGELTKLKKTAMLDFLKIMKAYGLFIDNCWNKSESIYRFPNGSFIEFLGMDKADVGKGFRRDVLYFNEINKGGITLDAYVQFASRANMVYCDFNPDRKFWLHEEIITDPDTDFLILTYQDNEHLAEKEVTEILKYKEKGFYKYEGLTPVDLFKESNIKSKYWANKWRVYGLGLVGSLDGVIFSNWSEIRSVPEEARYIGTGLDFGYSNDPTAIVDVYTYNGKRILDEVCYRTRLVNSDIARYLKGKGVVYADSAEPKSIEEIRRTGVDIRPASKGPDSIAYGINTMQAQEYLVTKRSINLKMELQSYTWAVDRDGNLTTKPIDVYNHLCDGIRYHEMMTVGLDKGFFTF